MNTGSYLSVLACNLILPLIPSVTFGGFGSNSSQDNCFCIFIGLCRNVLSRKSTSSVIHTVYWWTSVVIHRALCRILQPQRLNWVCSASRSVCSSNPYSRIRKPIQALQHRSAATLLLFLSLSLSTLTPYFILNLLHFSNLPSPFLFLTLHSLVSDSKMCLSLYLDALHSPSLLSLYHLSFFLYF